MTVEEINEAQELSIEDIVGKKKVAEKEEEAPKKQAKVGGIQQRSRR